MTIEFLVGQILTVSDSLEHLGLLYLLVGYQKKSFELQVFSSFNTQVKKFKICLFVC
jgi:hypothetical protein